MGWGPGRSHWSMLSRDGVLGFRQIPLPYCGNGLKGKSRVRETSWEAMEAITERNDGTPSKKMTVGLERRRLLEDSVSRTAEWGGVRDRKRQEARAILTPFTPPSRGLPRTVPAACWHSVNTVISRRGKNQSEARSRARLPGEWGLVPEQERTAWRGPVSGLDWLSYRFLVLIHAKSVSESLDLPGCKILAGNRVESH